MSDNLLNRNVSVDEDSIIAIANAIKGKMAVSAKIKPLDFAKAVNNIGSSGSGTINISNMNLTDVSAYASAQISDQNLISSNIKKGASILGVQGSPSVIDAIGGDAIPEQIAYTKTIYKDSQKVTGTNRIYVSGQTLYMSPGWIEVSFSGSSPDLAFYSGTELYAGQNIGVL